MEHLVLLAKLAVPGEHFAEHSDRLLEQDSDRHLEQH